MRKSFTVTVERTGGVDRYGDPQPAATHKVAGCTQWPLRQLGVLSGETYNRAFTEVSNRRVLWVAGRPDADIEQDDDIIYPDGSRWHVVGDPYPWENQKTGRRVGREVAIERRH